MRLSVHSKMWAAFAAHQPSASAVLYAVAICSQIEQFSTPPLSQLNRWLLMRRRGLVQRASEPSPVHQWWGAQWRGSGICGDGKQHPDPYSLEYCTTTERSKS